MRLITTVIAIVATVSALSALRVPSRLNTPVSSTKLSVVIDSNVPGQVPPMGFFDPLGLAARVDTNTVRKYRESEIKHGRVAMLAALGIPVSEVYHPIENRIMGPAIYHFQEENNLRYGFWVVPVILTFLAEIYSIDKGWEFTDETRTFKKAANLLPDYIPGDFGFDPMGLAPRNPVLFSDMQTKELQNGRLAMIAVAGMIAQELMDYKGIWEHYSEVGLFNLIRR